MATASDEEEVVVALESIAPLSPFDDRPRVHSHSSRSRPPAAGRKPRPRGVPRASQACQSCAKSKMRCDNYTPCKRCSRKNVRCVRSIQIQPRPHPPPPPASIDDRSDWNSVDSVVTAALAAAHGGDSGGGRGSLPTPAVEQIPLMHSTASEIDNMPVASTVPSDIQLSPVALRFQTADLNHFQTAVGLVPSDWNFDTSFYDFAEWDATMDDIGSNISANIPPPSLSVDVSTPAYGDPFIAPCSVSTPKSVPCDDDELEKAESVSDVYKLSIGRWSPGSHNYRVAEELDLSLGGNPALTAEDSDGSRVGGNSENWPFDVVSAVRGGILALTIARCDPKNVPKIVDCFPPSRTLAKLLGAYSQSHCCTVDSWIHPQSLREADTKIELIIACIAAGAMESPHGEVQKFGLALMETLSAYQQEISDRDNSLTRDLHHLQALALRLHIGLWSGVKRKMEMSGSFSGILANVLRCAGRFRRHSYPSITPSSTDTGNALESKWKNWREQESYKRLVYHLHVHCIRDALMTSTWPAMSVAELDLPLPESKVLWLAPTAAKWKAIYLDLKCNPLQRPYSLVDCLADPTRATSMSDLYDSQFAQLAQISGLHALIREFRHVESIFSAGEFILLKETMVSSDACERRLAQILHIIRDGGHSQSPERPRLDCWTLEQELAFMHMYANLDHIELMAGREGDTERKAVIPHLRQWIQGRSARQAAWHGGQLLKNCRELPPKSFTDFHVVACYHASLCLWAYGVLSGSSEFSTVDTQGPNNNDTSPIPVMLDGEEGWQSRRWISTGYGTPMIYGDTSSSSETLGGGAPTISLYFGQMLMDTIARFIHDKYRSRNGSFRPLMERICRLIQMTGRTARD